MRIFAAALTHVGRVRARNEDAVALGKWVESGVMEAPAIFDLDLAAPVVCLVADGMGGHAAGEVASRTAAEYFVSQADRATDAAAVAALLRDTNAELFELMRERPALAGMGTTVAGLVICPAGGFAFNVGDSRVYAIENGRLVQLSTDDTPGPKLEDGRTAAFTSNLITQTLGGAARLVEIEPHVEAVAVEHGARWLLASDGLTDLVDRVEIEAMLDQDDAAAVRLLFEAAMARGGRDNVSIVTVRITSGGS